MKKQIFQALREQILKGSMEAGEELPSTRELAQQLKVSRNTVSEAYDMLITEGYVISRQGAPTRVSEGLCMNINTAAVPLPPKKNHPPIKIDFHTGRPDLSSFPYYLWRQLMYRTAEDLPMELLGYTNPQGMVTLRTEIAAWLSRSKGLSVEADDIFITTGATQALHIITGVLELKGKPVAMEDPCNKGILKTFLNSGCDILPIPVDEHGLQTKQLDKTNAAAVYVTPSHQFPLGGILPAGRRAELIRYAREHQLYLLEDDYDSEFRYSGEPISPLYAMDPLRVIYIGTFSKVLFPALRIGYVILPRELQTRWCEQRTYTDVQSSPFEQAALAEFLKTRKFDRHIRSMRHLYRERRSVLLTALSAAFGDTWHAWGDSAGLHLVVEFDGISFDDAFFKSCYSSGLRIVSVEQHSIQKGHHDNKLLMGYGHLEQQAIQDGIKLLQSIIQSSFEIKSETAPDHLS